MPLGFWADLLPASTCVQKNGIACLASEWLIPAHGVSGPQQCACFSLRSTFIVIELRDVIGYRGEKILELRLTDYMGVGKSLFRPGFLGDKWPAIDFYVELNAVRGRRPYFFGQAKTTSSPLTPESTHLNISARKKDVERLLRVPGPTYIFGVHEPSQRVFVRSVHTGTLGRAITRIPLANELTVTSLETLHREVRDFWSTNDHKPASSVFS